MKKSLVEILDEVYVQRPIGYYDKETEKDLVNKGQRLVNTSYDDVTNTSTSDVQYLADFSRLIGTLQKMRKEILPYKYMSDEEIADRARETNLHLKKAENLIFALSKQIELYRKIFKDDIK